MNIQPQTAASLRKSVEAGFSLLVGLVGILFIAFVAAVAMGLMRIRWAVLGFLAAVILVMLIAALPDIKRYIKISSM